MVDYRQRVNECAVTSIQTERSSNGMWLLQSNKAAGTCNEVFETSIRQKIAAQHQTLTINDVTLQPKDVV